MAKNLNSLNLARILRTPQTERIHYHNFGLAHHKGIDRAALLSEPNILSGQIFLLVLVEVSGFYFLQRRRALAIGLPRPCAVDTFTVHFHPRGDPFKSEE